jgi:hypothetical protein
MSKTPKRGGGLEVEKFGTLAKAKSAAEDVVDVEAKRKKQLAEIKHKHPHLKPVARAHELACRVLEELTKSPGSRFLDIINGFDDAGHGNGGRYRGITVMSMAEYAQLKQKHEQRRMRLAGDISLSHSKLRRMVTKPQV